MDAKVDFLSRFRLTKGIARENLKKLTYYFKERVLRRRDILFKEGDIVDGIYFIKEGELEHSIKHKKKDNENGHSSKFFAKIQKI